MEITKKQLDLISLVAGISAFILLAVALVRRGGSSVINMILLVLLIVNALVNAFVLYKRIVGFKKNKNE